jgi:putative ABC transport system substrate-binding protein
MKKLLLLLVLLPLGAWAQQRVLMVLPREEQAIEQGFRETLQQQGLQPEIRLLRADGLAPSALQAALREQRPDLLYSWGTPTTLAVAAALDAAGLQRPLVFTEVTDPVGAGLVKDLQKPGRWITGVRHLAPMATQLAALRAYRPVRRIGMLVNEAEPNHVLARDALRQLAAEQGLQLIAQALPQPFEPAALPAQLQRLKAEGAEWLYVGPSTLLAFTHRDALSAAALAAGLPSFCATESAVRQSGCLFGLFANGRNVGRFAGYKAAKLLKQEAKPGELPIETLQRFSLLINVPVAKQLGLLPPLSLIELAELLPGR